MVAAAESLHPDRRLGRQQQGLSLRVVKQLGTSLFLLKKRKTIDPQTRQAWVSSGAALTETVRFTVENTPIYLDLTEMFAHYDKFR